MEQEQGKNEKKTGNRRQKPRAKPDRSSAGRNSRSAPKDSRPASKDSRPASKDRRSAPKDSRIAPTDSRSAPKDSRPASKDRRSAPKDESMRLNKYIAHAGICSRREADTLIEAGLVKVNGKVVSEMGYKIKPGDEVKYNDQKIGNEKKVYLVLNKPKDYITTVGDPHAKKTVMDLVRRACKERIYPVGRLDRNTTGVLLFTNDGDLTKRLTHPSYNKKKIYHVFLNRNLVQKDLEQIANGLVLDDGPVNVDAIAYASRDNKHEIGIEIHSGRNRIVRRIFESLGYEVTRLDRVYFAGLTKKNLPRGRYRFLTDNEIRNLTSGSYE